MHPALASVSHRPWAQPSGAWRWRQQWRDLLFAHWPVPSELIRPLVPEALEIDEYEGQTYIALVPFRMTGVMLRPLPDLPFLSAFNELNVRLYVKFQGKPGVWFLSLDADNTPAVWAARTFFNLPYFFARMSLEKKDDRFHYSSRREPGGDTLVGRYWPTGPVQLAEAGSLAHWLTERYCLYAQDPKGALWRTEVHHAPWPLQPAQAEIDEHTMFERAGVRLQGPPPLLHFSAFLDVVVWSPELVA
jgi:uncharacterized protein